MGKSEKLLRSFKAASPSSAFTLVEVIVALGIVAATVTSLVALLAVAGRSASEISARNRAGQLDAPLQLELTRLRDTTERGESALKLDALAAIIPAAEAAGALRLVGSTDGTRVVRESEENDSGRGVAPADRFYLIEVRQQAGMLAYTPGAGFLAVSALVRWPCAASGADGLTPVQTGSRVINVVVRP